MAFVIFVAGTIILRVQDEASVGRVQSCLRQQNRKQAMQPLRIAFRKQGSWSQFDFDLAIDNPQAPDSESNTSPLERLAE